MPKQQPGSGLGAVIRQDRQAEGRERTTAPRKDDAGIVSLRLPLEVKGALVEHIADLKAQGIHASMNSLVRVLIVEYLRDVEAGKREPPVTTRTEIGV